MDGVDGSPTRPAPTNFPHGPLA